MNIKNHYSIGRMLHLVIVVAMSVALPTYGQAQKRYDPGASDTEIKIGNTAPYSGPASAYGTIAKASGAYFTKINAEGGVNGRKIDFISADDAYNPSKTVEQTRKLVEQDEVLVMFGMLGTAQNLAIQRYLNAKKVPQLFAVSGGARFGDPKTFPWTMGWQPTNTAEGRVYAQHIVATKPNAKVAILMQNDDFGKGYLDGLLEGFGEKAKTLIVAKSTYEVTDPTIDSQMIALKASSADVFVNISSAKFAAQAIRKAAEIGWKPTQYLASASVSVEAVIKPAGFDNAMGVISSTFIRDPLSPSSKGTKELNDYVAFMKQYYPAGDPNETLNAMGYSLAQTLVQVLKQAGDNLTRENIMKQAANLSMTLPMLYPGIDIKTAADDYYPMEKIQMLRFTGTRFEPFGQVLGR